MSDINLAAHSSDGSDAATRIAAGYDFSGTALDLAPQPKADGGRHGDGATPGDADGGGWEHGGDGGHHAGEMAAAGGVVAAVLGSSAFKSFGRSAASSLGREITRGMFGTAKRRR